jgi:hypothetical protein
MVLGLGYASEKATRWRLAAIVCLYNQSWHKSPGFEAGWLQEGLRRFCLALYFPTNLLLYVQSAITYAPSCRVPPGTSMISTAVISQGHLSTT